MNSETDNPEKGQLLRRSEHHREQLEEEVKFVTDRTEKMITNALIIGGALALTYFLVANFSGSSKKTKSKARKIRLVENADEGQADEDIAPRHEAGIVSQIGSVLMAQATGFLLSIAREKLVEFLQSQSEKKDQNHERS